MKHVKPYKIQDTKNLNAYFTLLYGITHNQLDAVNQGIKSGALIQNLWLDEENGEDYLYEDPEDMPKHYVLISALDYAGKHCITEIYNLLMKTVKLTPQQEADLIFKSLANIDSAQQYSQMPELQEVFDKYITSKNINQYFNLKTLEDPLNGYCWREKNKQATFLHVAAHHKNPSIIQKLIDLGANPNLKIKGDDGSTPAHIVIESTPPKGDQSSGVNSLIVLLKNQANFHLVNNNGKDCWMETVSKFKIPELKIIFANHQPSDLKIIEQIKNKSPRLYEFWNVKSQGFKKYPLLDDIFKHEKRKILLEGNFAEVKNMEKFFKNKSLKQAIEQRYGTSSGRLTSVISKALFERSENIVRVNPKIFNDADLFKQFFLEGDSPNLSDFLEVLEKGVDSSDWLYSTEIDSAECRAFVKLIKSLFTPPQIKTFLLNSEEFQDSISDILDMYNQFPKELNSILKRTKFSEINSMQKLHDFFSGETNALSQENFKLEQDKVNPQLKALSKVQMPLGYGIKLAEENHELIRWGAMMGHCVGGGSYAESAKKGETIILAITKESEPSYCIEISPNGTIEQVQGKSRAVPSQEVMKVFVQELKKVGVLNRSQKATDWKAD